MTASGTKNKKSINSKKKSSAQNTNDFTANKSFVKYFGMTISAAILFIIFYPPYLRGLFFDSEQYPSEIFILAVFIAFWINKYLKNDSRLLVTPIDYAAAALAAVYFVSISAAVSFRLAISEWLKYCMYFAVFFMVTEFAADLKSKKGILWTIVLSAFGVSIFGIDGGAGANISNAFNQLFGYLHISLKFFGLYVNSRINSTLQYPNALASYLLAAFTVSTGLALMAAKLCTKLIASACGFVILLAFVFTFSKGAYIILPFAIILLIIVIPKRNKLRTAGYLAASAIPCTALVRTVTYGFASNNDKAKIVWFAVAAGIVISSLITALIHYFIHHLEAIIGKASRKVYLGVIAGITVFLIVIGVMAFKAVLPVQLNLGTEKNDVAASIKKPVSLIGGKEYNLSYDVEAAAAGKDKNAYCIDIESQNEQNIVTNKENRIVLFNEKGTNGREKRSLTFSVPKDSKIINITFSNIVKGSSLTLFDAAIEDKDTGRKIKDIILKYKYLPEFITSKFENLTENNSFVSRNIFYRDALKIFADHWLIGAGGGAWGQLYMAYQSYNYPSSQTHNYYLQLAIETGILGIIIFIFLVIAIIMMFLSEYRSRRQNDTENNILQAVLFTAALALMAHAAIDFDFSLSAVFLMLWVITALFNSRYRNESKQNSEAIEYKNSFVNKLLDRFNSLQTVKLIKVPPLIIIGLTVCTMILPIMFVSGARYAEIANEALKNNDLDLGIKNIENAISSDPIRPEYKADYAKLVTSRKNSIQNELVKANNYATEISGQAKNDAGLSSSLGEYYLSSGDIDKGLSMFEQANMLRPLNPGQWHQSLDAYYQVAMYFKQNKDLNSFKKYADKALALVDEAKAVNKKNINPFIFNDKDLKMLEELIYIKNGIETNENQDVNSLVFLNLPWVDINSDGIPDQWTTAEDNKVKFNVSGNQMAVESEASNERSIIQSNVLGLTEGKEYEIKVDLENGSNVKVIPYGVTLNGELIGNLEPNGSGMYSTKFAADKLDEKDSNVLKLEVAGKYIIKGISILEAK